MNNMNATTPTLEQMINMKLDERTNENKQMDNILSNMSGQNNGNSNYNKQYIQDIQDIQDEEIQIYGMPNMGGHIQMQMPNMGAQMQMPNMGVHMQMQKMGGNMPNMSVQMQKMGGNMPNMGSNMQNMGGHMQNMGMPNMGGHMQNMGDQNMGMPNMYKKNAISGNEIYGMQETNDLENDKTNKVISYIKNPLIVFIIFIILNLSIIIQTIDNIFAFCNNTTLINIINIIIRGLLAAILYFIISNLVKNI